MKRPQSLLLIDAHGTSRKQSSPKVLLVLVEFCMQAIHLQPRTFSYTRAGNVGPECCTEKTTIEQAQPHPGTNTKSTQQRKQKTTARTNCGASDTTANPQSRIGYPSQPNQGTQYKNQTCVQTCTRSSGTYRYQRKPEGTIRHS